MAPALVNCRQYCFGFHNDRRERDRIFVSGLVQFLSYFCLDSNCFEFGRMGKPQINLSSTGDFNFCAKMRFGKLSKVKLEQIVTMMLAMLKGTETKFYSVGIIPIDFFSKLTVKTGQKLICMQTANLQYFYSYVIRVES